MSVGPVTEAAEKEDEPTLVLWVLCCQPSTLFTLHIAGYHLVSSRSPLTGDDEGTGEGTMSREGQGPFQPSFPLSLHSSSRS